jgi:hypothetical protein
MKSVLVPPVDKVEVESQPYSLRTSKKFKRMIEAINFKVLQTITLLDEISSTAKRAFNDLVRFNMVIHDRFENIKIM